jgi:hypothetical protein
VEKKIKEKRLITDIMILVIFGIVLFDSYNHSLPFHYILFSFAGILAGKVYNITQKVYFSKEENVIKIELGTSAVIVTIITLFIRHFAGNWTLKILHIIWFSDALYLFFIGLYYSKTLIIQKQIDELVYSFLGKSKNLSDNKKL